VRTRGISPLVGLSVLLLAYLIVPIIAFVVRFAGQAGGITAQEAQPGGLFASLIVSLETASVATAVIAVLGTPLGYLLARAHGRTRDLIGVLVQLPLAMPPLVAGILLIYLVGPYTFLGQLFHGALTESRVGIVLAQIFVAAPFSLSRPVLRSPRSNRPTTMSPPLSATPGCRGSCGSGCRWPHRGSVPACCWHGYEHSGSSAPPSSWPITPTRCRSSPSCSSAPPV